MKEKKLKAELRYKLNAILTIIFGVTVCCPKRRVPLFSFLIDRHPESVGRTYLVAEPHLAPSEPEPTSYFFERLDHFLLGYCVSLARAREDRRGERGSLSETDIAVRHFALSYFAVKLH